MKDIPMPILMRYGKLGILLVVALLFGGIYGIIVHDKVILLLSVALAVCGGMKIALTLKAVKNDEFETVEGTLLSIKPSAVMRRESLLMSDADEAEHEILIAGKTRFAVGKSYRLYLSKDLSGDFGGSLPDQLRPARSLLGFEEI